MDATDEGFQAASGVEDLAVDIAIGATVGDALGTPAISLNPGSIATNRGTITVATDGGAGLFGTNDGLDDDDTTLTNSLTGIIDVNGSGGAGIRGAPRTDPDDNDPDPRIVQSNAGRIHVNTSGSADTASVGMDASDRGSASNSGTIQLGTLSAKVDHAVGMSGGQLGSRLENLPDGLIEGRGDFLTGMRIGDDNDIGGRAADIVSNRGTIRLTGFRAIGMDAGAENDRDLRFINDGRAAGDVGLILLRGSNAIGMRSANGSDVRNLTGARIDVVGTNAIGIEVQDGSSDDAASPSIINEGEIAVAGLNAGGISAGDDNEQIRNIGTIDVVGDSGAYGIRAGDRNEVRNSGDITVDSIDARGVQLGLSGLFQNQGGTITVSGPGSRAVEFLGGTSRFDNLISAAGVSASVEVSGSTAAAQAIAVLGGSGDDTIRNAGTILALGDRAIAVALGGGSNTLFNTTVVGERGVIEVGGFALSEPGLAVRGGSGSDRIVNQADIIGNIDLGGGNDTFEMSTDGTWVATSGQLGFIKGGTGVDEVVLNGTGVAEAPKLDRFIGFESLLIEGGGSWSLAGNGAFESVIVSGGDSAQNTTLELGGVVDLTGIYLQTRANLDVLVSSSDTRMLRASEITIVRNETVLSLELAGDANGTYTILQSEAALSADFIDDFTEVLISGSRVSTPTLVVVDLDEDGFLDSLVVTVTQDFALDSDSQNQRSIGNYLSAVAPNAVAGPFQTALAQLATLPAEDAAAALDQLSADAYDAQTSTAIEWGRSLARTLAGRPVRCESFHYIPNPAVRSLEPCGERGWTAWIEVIGLSGSRDGDKGFLSFEHSGGGIVLGLDRRFGDRWWASLSLASARIGIDLGANGNGTLQTADVGAAVGVNIFGATLRGILSYGQGWHTTRRDIGFLATRATGKHQSNRLSVEIEGGYPLHWRGVEIEPLASVNYTSLKQQAVNESGGAGMALGIAERSDSLFSTSLGARVSTALFQYRSAYGWLDWADGVWTPELTLRWRGVWSGADRYLDARVLGAPKGAPGYRVDARDAKWGAEFGARVNFQPLDTRVTFAVEYAGFWGDGSVNHHLALAARVPF